MELDDISVADKIGACKSHIKALKKNLSKAEYDYNRIPLKRKAAYRKLRLYAFPTIIVSMIVLMSVVSVIVLLVGGADGLGGLLLLFGLLVASFGGIACVWLWIRVVRIVEFVKDLDFQQILLEMQMDSIKKKMEGRSKELEELIGWQKEKSGV